jgi:hypothetical protein
MSAAHTWPGEIVAGGGETPTVAQQPALAEPARASAAKTIPPSRAIRIGLLLFRPYTGGGAEVPRV